METDICLSERKFIVYLTKWLVGERIKYIKMDIKRNAEFNAEFLELCSECISEYSFVEDYNDWFELIENKSLYFYVKNLGKNRKCVVFKNIILGESITEVAKDLGISKQLANAYKHDFIRDARIILSKAHKINC